jgi:short-subunit dehydrogenase
MASRAALVAGGSSGIGKALARVLGQEGHAVTICGRDEDKLAAAADELRAEDTEVRTAAGDLADEETVAEHGKALVVNVSSLAAKGGTPGMTFYAAAKAGVNALTESAQAEARAAGIQFTIFSPGLTATPMAKWTRAAGVAPDEMVQPSDLGEGLRFLLRTSPTCLVREIEFAPPAQREIVERLVAHRSRAAAER